MFRLAHWAPKTRKAGSDQHSEMTFLADVCLSTRQTILNVHQAILLSAETLTTQTDAFNSAFHISQIYLKIRISLLNYLDLHNIKTTDRKLVTEW